MSSCRPWTLAVSPAMYLPIDVAIVCKKAGFGLGWLSKVEDKEEKWAKTSYRGTPLDTVAASEAIPSTTTFWECPDRKENEPMASTRNKEWTYSTKLYGYTFIARYKLPFFWQLASMCDPDLCHGVTSFIHGSPAQQVEHIYKVIDYHGSMC